MCTVSWLHHEGGYQLFANRDERRSRAPAAAPRVLVREGVRLVAPLDGACGGTWIGTNEFGLSVCLLNGMPADAGSRSRGLLVLELLPSPSLADLAVRAGCLDLAPYAPFLLVALEPGSPAAVLEWDGRALSLDRGGDGWMPLASSSVHPRSVPRHRREQLARMAERAGSLHTGVLLAFHRSHEPEPGPDSACMHRADAETVSFTWVSVRGGEASMYYAPGPPCRSLAGKSYALSIRSREELACLSRC